MRLAVLLALLPAVRAQGNETSFPPGWNGEARKPVLGWRSWNYFGAGVSDTLMRSAIDALTAKNWTVDGELVSLADVGYDSVGIDEGWEGCGMGVEVNGRKTQHYANGTPAINAKFPDMGALVAYGHSKQLRMGWYLNGCACGEHVELAKNYKGDIQSLHDFGFDGVKIDGCGAQRNNTFYAELMRESGRNYSIENCHWGAMNSIGCKPNDDASACPSLTWCPFNWYRSSGDINAGEGSWFANLQSVIPYTKKPRPLSTQGCWAYPDMLEVGQIMDPKTKELDVPWNQAHFGAWCTVSSPLTLGLNLDSPNLAKIIPFITNKEAIAVNQNWAGHPGFLVASIDPSAKPDAQGFLAFAKGALQKGNDLTVTNVSSISDAEAWCKANSSCSGFTTRIKPDADTGKYKVYFKHDQTSLNTDANWTSFVKASQAPAGSGAQQVWAKPQPNGAVAVILINGGGVDGTAMTHSVKLSDLGLPSGTAFSVRDIWKKADAAGLEASATTFDPPAVGPRSSSFWLLSPKKEVPAVTSPYLGGSTKGEIVQKNLNAAIAKGAKSFTLPKGNVIFNATDFEVSGARGMTIQGFYSTTLWFNTGSGVRVVNCHDTTISTFAIDYWIVPYVQGTVTSVKAAGANSTYTLKLSPRSASPDSILPSMNLANGGAVWTVPKQMMNLAKVSAPISSCPTPPASGPFPTGTAPCPVLSYTSSGGTLSVSLPTVTPAVKPHDMMTFKASKGHTYVVANSSNVVTNLLTIRAAGWMAIYVK